MPRGRVLATVRQGDILLFWGFLWRHRSNGGGWEDFVPNDNGWYLLGCLRIHRQGVVEGGQDIAGLPLAIRARVEANAHYLGGGIPNGHRVFVGDGHENGRYSRKFGKAIDLGVTDENGLVYRTFLDADGNKLGVNYHGPHWCSPIRSCRRMWNLDDPNQRSYAEIVRRAILNSEQFDIFQDMVVG
jgi:hypothetical protein